MSGGEILGWISLGVSCLIGVLAFVTNRRANQTSEKQVDLEEQDDIARRRKEELDRLYPRLKDFETTVGKQDEAIAELKRKVGELERADRSKQRTIDKQAERITQMKAMFLAFVGRVEQAWKDGHTMPTLTVEERALLDDETMPVRHPNRGGSL